MNPPTKRVKPKRYILLDTNIFKHLSNSDLYPQIINLLKDAVSKGYGISYSIYSLFELIDSASVENEVVAMNATKGLKRYKINQTILIGAGHLGSMYKDDGVKKEPERGDKIIAATAIITNSVIFTTNGRDFPIPFFKVISTPLLKYNRCGRDVCLFSYFIEPDLDKITTKHKERIDEFEKKFSPPTKLITPKI